MDLFFFSNTKVSYMEACNTFHNAFQSGDGDIEGAFICVYLFFWKKLRGETHLTNTHAFIVWPVGSTFAGPTEGCHSRPGWICCLEKPR